MLAAIGLILIMKQIPLFLGADEDFFGGMAFLQPDWGNAFPVIGHAFSSIRVGALIIGATSLANILLWDSPKIKGNRNVEEAPVMGTH